METLRRSRTSTVVVKANGVVQTKKEAQVYVHDLGLFVTVQLGEDTLAVLSPGKLCEEQGYSYERVIGSKPQLIKQEKKIKCKTDKFVLLVFSRVVLLHWYKVVINIVIAGLVINKSRHGAK